MVRTQTQIESDALIARHIGRHLTNAGLDEYWLMEPGLPVWAIIGSLKANRHDTDTVAALYGISRAAVKAAWAFYLRHRAVIDNRIAQNDAA